MQAEKSNELVISQMKEKFYEKNLQDSRYNSVLMTKPKYDSIIEDVKRIKVSNKKESPRDYRIIQRYDVLTTVQGCEKLIEPWSEVRGESVKMFVHAEELFDILHDTHLSTGHGGRDRMIKQLHTLYKNITRAQIKTFLGLCEPCRQKHAKKGNVVTNKPITSSADANSRCQVSGRSVRHVHSRGGVHLIDYQSRPDGKFNFILVYQDHLTKFVVLKPLTSQRVDEVAHNLLDIFLLFGAPSILHSDNAGHEFCDKILESVTRLWPEIKMVNGKPRHSQTNQDIENMLITWMADNQTNNWSEGIRFVQFTKNRAYNCTIKQSPYEAMFGCPAKVGLSSSNIPQSVLHSINTEEDLEKLEDSQLETLNMGSQSNLTQEDIPLSPASTETQECCTSMESPLNVVKVITQLPSTSAESPLRQFRKQPVKRTTQDMFHRELEGCKKDVAALSNSETSDRPDTSLTIKRLRRNAQKSDKTDEDLDAEIIICAYRKLKKSVVPLSNMESECTAMAAAAAASGGGGGGDTKKKKSDASSEEDNSEMDLANCLHDMLQNFCPRLNA